MLGAFNKTIP